MLKFLKKKEEYPAVLEKQPMDYWEEYSYLVAIPEDEENFVLDNSIFDKIASIKNRR